MSSHHKLYTPELVYGSLPSFKSILENLLRKAKEVRYSLVSHTISTNPNPYIQEGISVHCHTGNGKILWSKSVFVNLFYDPIIKSENLSTGYEFLEEIKWKSVMNARVLDWLLEHKAAIPLKEWKGKKIFFWGTIYEGADCRKIVRYLDCTGSCVFDGYFNLRNTLNENSFALLVE